LQSDPLAFVLLGVAILGAIALHEYAHALAADLQGDRMPRAMGRLTLNPTKHLDPMGTLMIFLVGFGWGKPVEFRLGALNSRFSAAIVALAGPLMNLILAQIAAIFISILIHTNGGSLSFTGLADVISNFLAVFMSINVLLAVFNLMPLPPLDGSRLLTIFLPRNKQNVLFFLDRYGILILLGLLFFGGFTFLSPIRDAVSSVLFRIAGQSGLHLSF
jgi:Zn-dependent protease